MPTNPDGVFVDDESYKPNKHIPKVNVVNAAGDEILGFDYPPDNGGRALRVSGASKYKAPHLTAAAPTAGGTSDVVFLDGFGNEATDPLSDTWAMQNNGGNITIPVRSAGFAGISCVVYNQTTGNLQIDISLRQGSQDITSIYSRHSNQIGQDENCIISGTNTANENGFNVYNPIFDSFPAKDLGIFFTLAQEASGSIELYIYRW